VETVAASIAKTHRGLCVDEGWATYGISAELTSRIQHACFDDLDAPIERVGLAEVPMPYAKALEQAAIVHDEKILGAALSVLGLAPRLA
jgi:pyruvate dehydrogenase E1 component beta subunit